MLPLCKGKNSEGDTNSHRSISITSPVCKLLESIVKDLASSHIAANNSLSLAQHGFQPKKSTRINLICAENFISSGINNVCRRYFIRFFKVFG